MKRYSRVYASVNLDAAIENMEAMHRLLKKDTSMFAVIKTDGYGHGATELARVLEPLPYLHGFCVATVEEGVILRNHGIKKPILILGFAFPDEYEIIVEQKLEPAVFTYDMAVALSEAATRKNQDVAIHIAVDTGMSRIGYQVEKENAGEIAQISKLPHIIMEGIFTHFARADEKDKTGAHKQLELFQKMIAMCKEEGVIFDLLTNPTEIIADEKGWVKAIKCVRMELGEPDASGRRRPVVIEGSEFEMDVDTVIMSLGTSPNPLISSTTIGLDINKRKCIIADDETGATSKAGVYAGGDAVTGAATVILAMGAGKAAAKGIDEFIKNKAK